MDVNENALRRNSKLQAEKISEKITQIYKSAMEEHFFQLLYYTPFSLAFLVKRFVIMKLLYFLYYTLLWMTVNIYSY